MRRKSREEVAKLLSLPKASTRRSPQALQGWRPPAWRRGLRGSVIAPVRSWPVPGSGMGEAKSPGQFQHARISPFCSSEARFAVNCKVPGCFQGACLPPWRRAAPEWLRQHGPPRSGRQVCMAGLLGSSLVANVWRRKGEASRRLYSVKPVELFGDVVALDCVKMRLVALTALVITWASRIDPLGGPIINRWPGAAKRARTWKYAHDDKFGVVFERLSAARLQAASASR